MTSTRVVWLYSLARSGSSVVAYASGAALGHAVADEILGPWDRTGPPYGYPPEQAELVRLFKASGHELTDEVVELTNRVLAMIAGPSGVVISKWPHLRPSPGAWRGAFPDHASAALIRNPLHRLNSLHRRGWTGAFGRNQDLDRFRQFARWWSERDVSLTYDQFKADPRAFFRRLWTGWGLEFDQPALDRAVAYAREHYHASSRVIDGRPEGLVLSEREFALPEQALSLYLGDGVVRRFMERMGWSTDPADYRPAPDAVGAEAGR